MNAKKVIILVLSIICVSFSYVYIKSRSSKPSYFSSFFNRMNSFQKVQKIPSYLKAKSLNFKKNLYKKLSFLSLFKRQTDNVRQTEEKEQDTILKNELPVAKYQDIGKQIIPYKKSNAPVLVQKTPISNRELEEFKREVQKNLSFDLISHKKIARMMRGFKYINKAGTLLQKKWALSVITTQKSKLISHLNNGFASIVRNQDFINGVKVVGVSVIGAGTGTAIFNILQFTGGRTFEPEVLQKMGLLITHPDFFQKIGLLSAEAGIAQLIAFSRGKNGRFRLLDQFMAKAVMTSVGLIKATPLTYAIGILSNEASEIFTKAINSRGGISELVNKIDWHDVAIGKLGPPSKAIKPYIEQHQNIVSYGKSVIKNVNVKALIGTIAKEAMFSAVLGGAIYMLGLGFSDETEMASTFNEALVGVGTSMAYGAIRGGVQGLIEYTLVGAGRAGAITKTATASTIRAVQRYLSGQAAWSVAEGVVATVAEVTPIVVKQFAKSVTETVINQMGGTEAAVKEVLSAASESATIHFKTRKKEFIKLTQPTTQKVDGWFSSLTKRISNTFVIDINLNDIDMTGTV